MIQYQRITLKESGEEMVVGAMEYPYQQAGILYIKFIVYQEIFAPDGTVFPPDGRAPKVSSVGFLTVQPQDILKREYEWSQAAEDELVAAAEAAAEQEMVNREMYQKAAEEEMARRSALINAPEDVDGGQCGGLFG